MGPGLGPEAALWTRERERESRRRKTRFPGGTIDQLVVFSLSPK
jgi:hypothetical protein